MPCHIVEARNTGSGACDCNTPSRSPVPAADQCLVEQAKNDPLFSTAQWNCFCAVDQATGADLTACQGDAHDPPSSSPGHLANGWCYVDATVGNPEIVASCPVTEPRQLRFAGAAAPAADAMLFVSCDP